MEPTVEIPNRAAFKASEVCEIARIPAYVLRSWEREFPALGMAAKPGGPRIYRRSDVEQILRIRQLVFVEGMTLAGARRAIDGEPPPDDDALPEWAASDEVRSRVAKVKVELRSLLAMLSGPETRSEPPRPLGDDRAVALVADPPSESSRPRENEQTAALVAERSDGAVLPWPRQGVGERSNTWLPVPPTGTAVAQAPAPAAQATARAPAGTPSVLPLLEGVPDTPPSRHRPGRRRPIETRALPGASEIE